MIAKNSIVRIVIPTHNRSRSLKRALDALCCQTYPLSDVEVVVVLDGCTDRTKEMLQRYVAPFALSFIECANQGPAAARNRGAAYAGDKLLLFLDDDVEPTSSLVEAHVRAHQERPGQAVVGPYLPVFHEKMNFLHGQLRAWWEKKFVAMGQPGHCYGYTDVLSGNFSLEARLFARLGGFNPSFWVHEDYEFGMRLIKAGIPVNFSREALGHHHEHETTTLDHFLHRKQQEGKADVLLGMYYPELRPSLPLAGLRGVWFPVDRLVCILAFIFPGASGGLCALMRRVLGLVERTGLRGLWRLLFGALHRYLYWQGVAEKLRRLQALSAYLANPGAGPDEIGLGSRHGSSP